MHVIACGVFIIIMNGHRCEFLLLYTGDGIEYDEKCNCKVSYAFFEEFSFRFAKAARGTIFYLGHGESTNGAFNKMSIFAEIEIPNLDSTSVRSAVILVVHNTTVNKSGTL